MVSSQKSWGDQNHRPCNHRELPKGQGCTVRLEEGPVLLFQGNEFILKFFHGHTLRASCLTPSIYPSVRPSNKHAPGSDSMPGPTPR